MLVCMCLPTPPNKQDATQSLISKRSLTGINSVFLLLDRSPYQGEKVQSTLLFIHGWRENSWIHAFSRGFNHMWNANNLVQDLNWGRRVHFLRQQHFHVYMYVCLYVYMYICVYTYVYSCKLIIDMYICMCYWYKVDTIGFQTFFVWAFIMS